MASSSSANPQDADRDLLTGNESVTSPRLYDVFINHRGPDVKDTLATQLYQYLKHRECRSFLDSREMELGDLFPPTIRNAIESAVVQIAIFSPRYAESSWCLTELTHMLQTNVLFIPVFYHVRPTDLRHINKGAYAAAFDSYRKKGRFLSKLAEWEKALNDASLFDGYEYGNDWEVLLKIESAVMRELQKRTPLDVARHPVGLDELVDDFEEHFPHKERGKAKIIGIFGMGGSGKTTLAKELFNRKRSQYSGACFLNDVRESSIKGKLPSLQAKLLKDLFCEDHCKFQNADEGTNYLRHRLERGSSRSFFIVLDDIDHICRLNALGVSDKLNSGSLVIVTGRDENMLQMAGITLRYRLKEMSLDCSRQLFCWHAFHQPYPASGYEDLVESYMPVCGGLPLSLQLLGGRLFGSSEKYWNLELAKSQKTLPLEIKHNIRISYDTLDNEQKQIFMDIACFFIGRGKFKSMAITIWEGSGWMAEHGLQILVDKCLVVMEPVLTTNSYTEELYFRMHGHIRDFGREMADELNHPRRMWQPQDLQSLDFARFKNIFMERSGPSVRCLHGFFHSYINTQITYFIGNSDCNFGAPTVLLWMELEVNEHLQRPFSLWNYLQNFWRAKDQEIYLGSLQGLEIVNGVPSSLWRSGVKNLFFHTGLLNLKNLRLDTKSLQELSYRVPSCLQILDVYGTDGVPFSESILSIFSRLRNLSLRDLSLPAEELVLYGMLELEKVDIRSVKHVRMVSAKYCHSLRSLRLEFLEDLIRVTLEGTSSLSSLVLKGCRKLEIVSIVADETSLVDINIGECWSLQELLGRASHHRLERITMDGCRLWSLGDTEELERLKYLYLSPVSENFVSSVYRLQTLRRLPSEFLTIIGEAAEGAESALIASLFFRADAVSEIVINENGEGKASLPKQPLSVEGKIDMKDKGQGQAKTSTVATPQPLSAIMVCCMLQITRPTQFIHIPLPPNRLIKSRVPEGQWIVTTVVTDPQKLVYAERYMAQSNWIPRTPYEGSSIKRGFVAAMNEGQEDTTMYVFQKITRRLYR